MLFSRQRWTTKTLEVVLLALAAVIMVMPFYWMVITSFKSRPECLLFPVRWLPTAWHFENYPEAVAQGAFGRYFFNSAFVATVDVVARVFFAALVGYALAKYQYPVLRLLLVFIVGTMMIPTDVILIPLYMVMRRFGWINTYCALIMGDLMGAFGIFLMRQVCLDVPDELIDAARIDGSSEFGIWWRVVVPNVKAALVTVATIDFLMLWNSFYWPLLVIGKDELRTVPLALSIFQSQRGSEYHWLMAVSTLMTVPTVAMFVALQRQYMASMMRSGLKL